MGEFVEGGVLGVFTFFASNIGVNEMDCLFGELEVSTLEETYSDSFLIGGEKEEEEESGMLSFWSEYFLLMKR